MKQRFFLLTVLCLAFLCGQSSTISSGIDSVQIKQASIDSLNRDRNLIEVRQLKFEILRHLRDDRYQYPDQRASIDSGIVLLVNFTDSIQRVGDKDQVLDGKLYLRYLLSDFILGDIPSNKSAQAIQGYLSVRALVADNSSIYPVITQMDPVYCHPILQSIRQKEIAGWRESTNYMVCETFGRHPSLFLRLAFEFPGSVCIDSLLPAIAKQQPEELYRFAQAGNSELGRKISQCNDDLVKLIVTMAGSKQGRAYYPFLDDLYHKKRTIAEIDKTLKADNRVAYYQLLIKTLIAYNERVGKGEAPIAMDGLLEKVAYITEMDFIKVINSLHDSPDAVRLRVISRLTPQELYYLCIYGEKDLYTSSYLKIYNTIFAHQAKLNTYRLLSGLHFDHFRRFIKMAGTFNTLDDFLARMTKDEASSIMHSFIDGLNTTASLEEVTDVANSYASIRNDSLRRYIMKEVSDRMQLEREDNSKARKIYTLLNTLFLSLDPANNINLTSALGIPDVYQLTQNSLRDSSGRIIIQQFFYGDPDGVTAYNTFLQWLKKSDWQITTNKFWIEAVSKKNSKIHLYANLPLSDNSGQAENAQVMLHDFLVGNNMVPSIMIHRGHSYFAKHTVTQLNPGNKLIIMGSCGGFSQISAIYKRSPNAQMISTKQEGSVTVNQPMIGYILNTLEAGKDLNWPEIWARLTVVFKKNDRFDDYVPPYQNLGAVLLQTGL